MVIDNLSIGNEQVQRVMVEKSTRHKWVKRKMSFSVFTDNSDPFYFWRQD